MVLRQVEKCFGGEGQDSFGTVLQGFIPTLPCNVELNLGWFKQLMKPKTFSEFMEQVFIGQVMPSFYQ